MKNEKETEDSVKIKTDIHLVRSLIAIFVLIAMISFAITFLRVQINNASNEEPKYRYHYVFVGGEDSSRMIDSIYGEAVTYGDGVGVYVEALDVTDDSDEAYADKIRMAVAMGVDGIILAAEDTDTIKAAIDEATAEEIPVLTVLSDCPSSLRKTVIEQDYYDLGRMYARGIIGIADVRDLNIAVLISDEYSGLFMDGLKDTLANEGNHLNVNLITNDVTDMPNFRLMNLVEELLTDEKQKIDILLCPDEYGTQIVYQAIKDYDLTGRAKLIGYGITESLLRAVAAGEVSALVYIDSVQAGMLCIDALTNYIESGITRDSITAENIIITKDNIERYLDE
jgi:ribose transport system substrate-binding protein